MDTHLQQLINELHKMSDILSDYDHDKAHNVLKQLSEMGAAAAPASGLLGRLLVQKWYRENLIHLITQTLIKIGPGAAPASIYSIQEMAKPNNVSARALSYACSDALIAIGPYPDNLYAILTLAVDLYNEYDNTTRSFTSYDLSVVRQAIRMTLEGFGHGAAPLIPTLVGYAKGPNPDIAWFSVQILGSIGAAAVPALRKIAGLFSDYPSDVKRAAREAINRIKN